MTRDATRRRPRARPSGATLLAAAIALSAIAPAIAVAAPDYGSRNPEWNGLTELHAVARAEGIELVTADGIDVDRLDPRDGLLLVYPRHDLPVASILDRLRAGGRVALADDFGEGRSLLRRFAIERGVVDGAGAPRLRDRDALLVAHPRIAHPLAEGVEAIVTNHPTALRHPELEPVFAFGEGPDALVLSGTVGDGRLVAIADPSVLINQMLAIDGNRRFAAALLRFLVADGSGRVVLVAGDARLAGRDGDDPMATPIERMDEMLRAAAQADVPARALAVAAIVLCGIVAAVASGAVALRGPYGAETMLPPSRSGGGFSGWLRFYLDPARARGLGAAFAPSRNLLHPTLMYKTELEATLATTLGLPGDASARRIVDAMPPRARDDARPLLAELEALERGERDRAAVPHVGARAFRRIHARGEALAAAAREARR